MFVAQEGRGGGIGIRLSPHLTRFNRGHQRHPVGAEFRRSRGDPGQLRGGVSTGQVVGLIQQHVNDQIDIVKGDR